MFVFVHQLAGAACRFWMFLHGLTRTFLIPYSPRLLFPSLPTFNTSSSHPRNICSTISRDTSAYLLNQQINTQDYSGVALGTMASSGVMDALRSVVQHVFLPPHLPSGRDNFFCTSYLVTLVLSSLREFASLQDETTAERVGCAIASIENFKKTRHDHIGLSEKHVNDAFDSLISKGMLRPAYEVSN